jgi:hypothetical protein
MDLLRMFVAGATARATAEIVGVHRNAATSFYMHLIVPKLTKEKMTKPVTENLQALHGKWKIVKVAGGPSPKEVIDLILYLRGGKS